MIANVSCSAYRKMKQVLQMYRQGHIKPPPIKVFDASKIGEAYRYFSLRERIGKVIESLENPAMQIQVGPPYHRRSDLWNILVSLIKELYSLHRQNT